MRLREGLQVRALGDILPQRLVLPQLAGVVARAGLAARLAAGLVAVINDHLDRAGGGVDAHVSNVPRRGDSEDLDVEVAVAHPRTVTPGRRGPDQPAAAQLSTRIPEDSQI
jgi:hypothetical protein